jgi:hypothetical protein
MKAMPVTLPFPPALNPRLVVPMAKAAGLEKGIPPKRKGESSFQQHIRGEMDAMKEHPSHFPGGKKQAIAIAASEAGVARKAQDEHFDGYMCKDHGCSSPKSCPEGCPMRKAWEQRAMRAAGRVASAATSTFGKSAGAGVRRVSSLDGRGEDDLVPRHVEMMRDGAQKAGGVAGEGARGGVIVGHTSGGKPVYESTTAHIDAARKVLDSASRGGKTSPHTLSAVSQGEKRGGRRAVAAVMAAGKKGL